MQLAFGDIYKSRVPTPCRAAATLLLLVSAAWTAEPGAVEGVVRNSATEAPVASALVRLICENGPGYAESTGADGSFRFQKVEPGEYRIEVARPGFTAKEADILHVISGHTTRDVALSAVPHAAIRGKVLDAEGEPVPGARVAAITTTWVRGKRTWQNGWVEADERGEFRVTRLEPGRYRLFAAPPTGNPLGFTISEGPGTQEFHLAPAYYPSGQDLDGAAVLDVAAGQEIGGLELRLPMQPAFHVRGTADAAPDSRGPMPIAVSAVRIDNGRWADWFQTSGQLKKDGSFDISGVTPGVYAVRAERFGQGVTESVGIKVTARDINGVALVKMRPAKVRLRYVYSGAAAPENGAPQFSLERAGRAYGGVVMEDAEPAFPRMTRQHDGTILFENVVPGLYQPMLGAGEAFYVQSMTFNGHGVTDAAIEVDPGSESELEVMLAQAPAALTGKVKTPGNVAVMVVAENATAGNRTVRSAIVDAAGRFSVRGMPPGRYLVFATRLGGMWPWENSGFVNLLNDYAAEVEIKEKGGGQVEVPVVPEDALRRAAEQVP
jgi:hypothetical protein